MFEIKGKTAVVTGGTSGIGLATAKAFLQKGAKVVIAGRNEERGAKALEELKQVSPDVVFHQTDTSDSKQVRTSSPSRSRPTAPSTSCTTTRASQTSCLWTR